MKEEPAGFIGVSTFVVTKKILSSSETNAEVMVSAQREETTAGGNKLVNIRYFSQNGFGRRYMER